MDAEAKLESKLALVSPTEQRVQQRIISSKM